MVCGCRSKERLSPGIESELRALHAATVPQNATNLVKGEVESTTAGIRAVWRFQAQHDVGGFLGDVERRLASSYRCHQAPKALRCAKALPGDHLDLEMVGVDVADGVIEWRIELKGRPD
jgi:hypothetical protein